MTDCIVLLHVLGNTVPAHAKWGWPLFPSSPRKDIYGLGLYGTQGKMMSRNWHNCQETGRWQMTPGIGVCWCWDSYCILQKCVVPSGQLWCFHANCLPAKMSGSHTACHRFNCSYTLHKQKNPLQNSSFALHPTYQLSVTIQLTNHPELSCCSNPRTFGCWNRGESLSDPQLVTRRAGGSKPITCGACGSTFYGIAQEKWRQFQKQVNVPNICVEKYVTYVTSVTYVTYFLYIRFF